MDDRGVGLHQSRPVTSAVCVPSQQRFHTFFSRFVLALVFAALAGSTGLIKAANQGSTGSSSSASFTISLNIPPRITVQTLDVSPNETITQTVAVIETAEQVLVKSRALDNQQTTIATYSTNDNEQTPPPAASAETTTLPVTQKALCIKGTGMPSYSLQASGSRYDDRLVLQTEAGNELPYEVVLTNASVGTVDLQTPASLPLEDSDDCSTSPVVSINLSDSALSNLQNSSYYGAAQVTVAAE